MVEVPMKKQEEDQFDKNTGYNNQNLKYIREIILKKARGEIGKAPGRNQAIIFQQTSLGS